MSETRAQELGAFLRTRRDRLMPADIGLHGGGRRRVAGLRREEVAVRANVGTTWYTWLEQGRDVNPSVPVLEAIADALLLNPEERRHLLLLGGHAVAAGAAPICERVKPRVQRLLDALLPSPAVVMNTRMDLAGFNLSYRYLLGFDLAELPDDERNLAWLAFTHPRWLELHPRHLDDADLVVAKLRANYADSVDDPGWESLLGRLRAASPLFTRLWASHNVRLDADRVKQLRLSNGEEVGIETIVLQLVENPRLRLTSYQGADERSQRALYAWASSLTGVAAGPS